MIELVLVDVDGTLVGGDGVPDSAWPALAAARADGLRLAICTGRPSLGRQRAYARQLDPDGVHIFDAGGALTRADGEVVQAFPIAIEALRAAAAIAEEADHVLELYPADGRYLVLRETAGVAAHAALLDSPAQRTTLAEVAEETIVRAQFLVAPGTSFDAARPRAAAIPGCHLHEATSPVMPGYRFCALTHATASKVAAARWLARHWGLTLAQVAAIGDGDNDRDLIAAAGFGVAMGNASEGTKAAADAVVGHVDAGGLAEALVLVRALRGAGARPPWQVGQRLRLQWLRRNATAPADPRPAQTAQVIESRVDSVTVRREDGASLELSRANGHQRGVARDAPRWVASFDQGPP